MINDILKMMIKQLVVKGIPEKNLSIAGNHINILIPIKGNYWMNCGFGSNSAEDFTEIYCLYGSISLSDPDCFEKVTDVMCKEYHVVLDRNEK